MDVFRDVSGARRSGITTFRYYGVPGARRSGGVTFRGTGTPGILPGLMSFAPLGRCTGRSIFPDMSRRFGVQLLGIDNDISQICSPTGNLF